MTITIISRHSKTIHKLVEEQMKKEAQELGFDPWGDTAEEEFERRVTNLEPVSYTHLTLPTNREV